MEIAFGQFFDGDEEVLRVTPSLAATLTPEEVAIAALNMVHALSLLLPLSFCAQAVEQPPFDLGSRERRCFTFRNGVLRKLFAIVSGSNKLFSEDQIRYRLQRALLGSLRTGNIFLASLFFQFSHSLRHVPSKSPRFHSGRQKHGGITCRYQVDE